MNNEGKAVQIISMCSLISRYSFVDLFSLSYSNLDSIENHSGSEYVDMSPMKEDKHENASME